MSIFNSNVRDDLYERISDLEKELEATKKQLAEAVQVIQNMYDAEGFDTEIVNQFLAKLSKEDADG